MSGSGTHRSHGLANRHHDDRVLGEGRHPRMTLVSRRRRIVTRAVTRRSVEKSFVHQELERRSARPGRKVGVSMGVRGREGGGRWVPGVAGLGEQCSARRQWGGVVRSTTTRRFLGEGTHEPIPPRRWTMSAGIDGIGDLGLVLGNAEQSLRMRFGLLRRDHHSSIVGHSPDQPWRASSSETVGWESHDRCSVFSVFGFII